MRDVASLRRVAFESSEFRHFWRFPWKFPGLQAHAPHSRQQLLSLRPQIGERKQGQHVCGVFGQAAIAELGVAELVLDHPERMLHLRAHAGLEVFPMLFPSTLALVADGPNSRGPDGNVAEHAVFFAV